MSLMVERGGDEGGDLLDRIANHPIVQLLNLRRKSRSSSGAVQRGSAPIPSTSADPKFQVGVYTPRGRRHERGKVKTKVPPCRSVSTHHIAEHRVRPIGLSKSDDEILNRASDSFDEDDFQDYIEDQNTKDLSADLDTLNMNEDDYFKNAERNRKTSGGRKGDGKGKLSKSQAAIAPKPSLRPLEIRSPPGTAPLPVKFSKKTSLTDKSPSSWFSPPRQKDLNLPVKKSLSRDKTLCKNSPPSISNASLNVSMEVLLDNSSQRGFKSKFFPPNVSVKYSSIDSVVTGSTMSSLESLRSSMSDGSKSTASNESTFSSYKSSLGSDSSLLSRPTLNLSAPHRSLIQSAKFQILSPISDKSQEPSSETGAMSQKSSPQDLAELTSSLGRQKTPIKPRNIQDDFRNFHHMLPGPPREQGDLPGSDSGISIEYGLHKAFRKQDAPFSDLPFDMPKLRRRLAAAKTSKSSLSSSNSSISSGATSESNPRLSLPAGFQPSPHPAIARLQLPEGRSGTSSSTSSDWDTRSSAESSDDQGTPKSRKFGLKLQGSSSSDGGSAGRSSLALDLGCAAMTAKGEEVDINLPLHKQGWYHGVISRTEAESTLRSQTEGSYLVRTIDTARHEYSLSLKSARGFMHLRIHFDCTTGYYTLGRSSKPFPSVPHMVQHHSITRLPIKGAEHMVLLYPVAHETL
ncbi:uncharacterized protein LOC143019630 isoform X2 [Oratosquilla oratoria]|uniref:uncharacterized protein LOC143019630 isoform X2 n=1 Tax=Oratosquilla oratoria TaxID=337810 RepID=UPI003F771531